MEANTDGSDAGARPAAVHAASATSSATATVSGARRRSLGASSCGDGCAGASGDAVHNAAAGYWTIGAGAMQAATAISAYDATFAQGLLEAMVQLATGNEAVLLVGYDGHAIGPLARVSRSEGVLGAALVLSRLPRDGLPQLRVTLDDGHVGPGDGALVRREHANAMAQMLPLFDALADGRPRAVLKAGPGRVLRVELGHA